MKERHLAILMLVVLLFVMMTELFYSLPRTSSPLASHFDTAGVANGWMTKSTFSLVYSGPILLMSALALALGPLVNRLPWLLSLPHRDYWLAPERRKSSLTYIDAWTLWFNNVTILFLLGVVHLTLEANREAQARLDVIAFAALAALYLGFTTLWLTRLFGRFRKPACIG